MHGFDLFCGQFLLFVHFNDDGSRRFLFFAGKHFAARQYQVNARPFDVFDCFNRARQLAFQSAEHLQIDDILTDAGGLRFVKDFIADDTARADRFRQLNAQFQSIRDGHLDFRSVFQQFVLNVLFIQLRDDFFCIRGVQFVEQNRHFRFAHAACQINQKSQQKQRNAAHSRQPRQAQIFQRLQKRIHFAIPTEQINFLSYSIRRFH